MSRPSWEAQQTASVSSSIPNASSAPDSTMGWAWNGFAHDRMRGQALRVAVPGNEPAGAVGDRHMQAMAALLQLVLASR